MPGLNGLWAENLLAQGARFETLIHPDAVLGQHVDVGTGAIICPGAVLSCDCVIGDFSGINMHATISHDAKSGNFLKSALMWT